MKNGLATWSTQDRMCCAMFCDISGQNSRKVVHRWWKKSSISQRNLGVWVSKGQTEVSMSGFREVQLNIISLLKIFFNDHLKIPVGGWLYDFLLFLIFYFFFWKLRHVQTETLMTCFQFWNEWHSVYLDILLDYLSLPICGCRIVSCSVFLHLTYHTIVSVVTHS